MNVNTESRVFTVFAVDDVPNENGRYGVLLTFGDTQWKGECLKENRPTVGQSLNIFYREGELDWAFEGLFNVEKILVV